MQRMSAASAARSSASVLPTPENRILRRRDAGRQRPLQLATGDHVGAGAELGQGAQHRLVGIGLHGVADQSLLAGKGLGEDPVVALKRRRRIAIERRAHGVRELEQIDRFGVQHAVAIVEVIYGALSCPATGRGRRIFFLPLAAVGGPIDAKGRIEDAGLAGTLGFRIDGRACGRRFAAVGGKSSPPLRPQPPSANEVTLSKDDGPSRRGQPVVSGHDEIPNSGPHHTKIALSGETPEQP